MCLLTDLWKYLQRHGALHLNTNWVVKVVRFCAKNYDIFSGMKNEFLCQNTLMGILSCVKNTLLEI